MCVGRGGGERERINQSIYYRTHVYTQVNLFCANTLILVSVTAIVKLSLHLHSTSCAERGLFVKEIHHCT